MKVAVICDFASQFLVQALKGYGIGEEINYEIFEAGYNQIELQILDPSSRFYEFNARYAIILRSSEKLRKEFYKTPPEERAAFAQKQADHTRYLYDTILGRIGCIMITNTFPEINDGVFGNFSTKLQISLPYQIKYLNILLMDLARACKGMFLADFSSIVARSGQTNSFDPRIYINADVAFSLDILPDLVKNLHDVMQAVAGRFKKCLILDLDNTIWGGIIGDDGMEGIEIGDLGVGNVFTGIQLWIKELRSRGIILAVCSKNTEEVAKEPFENHPDMVLRLSDIAVFVANWENKADNIRYIQKVLNISFDSMVLLDDNPFERAMVKREIPDITVPVLPEDPAEYLVFLEGQNLFETASFTEEDRHRTGQYLVDSKRTLLQQNYANEDGFLNSLQMRSEAAAFDQFTIPRIAQLSQRSNQFNLRTIRYTEEQIMKFAADKDCFTISFTLQDIFGDNGLVSAIVLRKKGDYELFVDTWIMSCRVLKRGMENFVLNMIVKVAQDNGFKKITGEYIPTQKNGMVKNHYPDLGFSRDGDFYSLAIADFKERKTFIKNK